MTEITAGARDQVSAGAGSAGPEPIAPNASPIPDASTDPAPNPGPVAVSRSGAASRAARSWTFVNDRRRIRVATVARVSRWRQRTGLLCANVHLDMAARCAKSNSRPNHSSVIIEYDDGDSRSERSLLLNSFSLFLNHTCCCFIAPPFYSLGNKGKKRKMFHVNQSHQSLAAVARTFDSWSELVRGWKQVTRCPAVVPSAAAARTKADQRQ